MGRKYNYLTKSKITSGLQCQKKLWFDVHQPLKIQKAIFPGILLDVINLPSGNWSVKSLQFLDLK